MRLGTVPRFLLPIAPLAGLLAAPSARAEGSTAPLAVRLRVEGPCPRGEFLRDLVSAVRRPLDTNADDATTELAVRFVAGRTSASGEARFVGRSGDDARTVRGRTCAEVSAAVALVASTWLDAEHDAPAPSPPTPPTPPSVRVHALPELVAEDPDATREPTPEPRSDVTVAALAFIGAREVSALGVEASGGVRRGTFGLRGGARGIAGGRHDGGPQHVWITSVVSGCADLLEGGHIAAAGCARLDPGVVVVSGARVEPWLSAGAGPRLVSSVGRVRVELGLLAVLPILGGSARSVATRDDLPIAVEGSAAASYGFE